MSIKGMRKDRMKRAAAAAAAAVIAASSVTGCSSSTDYSLTANGKKVNAGVYINYILNEMTTQMYQMYYTGEIQDISECFTKQVEGQDFITYVKDKALESTKEFAAVQAKFDELGLSLSSEDTESIETSISNAWNTQKDFYEYQGVSRESLKQCSELSYKKTALFDHFYSADGTEAVTDENIQQYVNDNYIRYKIVAIPKSTETEEEAKNKENEELKALWEQYIKEAEELDFAGFDKVIGEYDEYKKQKTEENNKKTDELIAQGLGGDDSEQVIDVDVPEAEAAKEESSETAEVTTAATSEAPAETAAETTAPADEEKPADTEDKPAETSAPTESEAPATSEETSSAAETAAPTESASEEGTAANELIAPAPDAAEEETDPYANEEITNYTEAVDSSDQYYSENYAKLLEDIKKTEYGKVGKHENNDFFYLFMPADVSERTDYVPDHRNTILHKMKDGDFDLLVKGWIDAASIVVNEKAMKRYTVKSVYERQEEYSSKQR